MNNESTFQGHYKSPNSCRLLLWCSRFSTGKNTKNFLNGSRFPQASALQPDDASLRFPAASSWHFHKFQPSFPGSRRHHNIIDTWKILKIIIPSKIKRNKKKKGGLRRFLAGRWTVLKCPKDIKRHQKTSKDIKRHQKTSKDIKRHQKTSKDINISFPTGTPGRIGVVSSLSPPNPHLIPVVG